jgi:glyoxylase-like metal-dependent hydrolase (beta-lactamase superfamily II)
LINFDLFHNDLPGAIGVYLRLEPEPLLVDPGPSTSLGELNRGLEQHGLTVCDLRHVLLTHVHLDHAGATGDLAAMNPALTVHVHMDGAVHMAQPEKLVASTRRTFGELHDLLWGEVRPVPQDRIRPWVPGERFPLAPMRPISTPGHIAHHVAWLDESDGTLMAGDSLGIILGAGAPTHPATPPPAVDLEAWPHTLDEILAIAPERVGVTHFGLHADAADRVEQMRDRLRELTMRVMAAVERGDEDDAARYNDEVRHHLSQHADADRVERYFDCFGAESDWAGVAFYLKRNPAPAWID